MKKLLTLGLAVLFCSPLFAQSNKEEIDYIQAIYGMEKKAIISDFIKLEKESADAFWELYDNYETERKALGQGRIELLNEYAKNYNSMEAEYIDELIQNILEHKSQRDALISKYYKKMKASSNVIAAAQFVQIENYFLSAIRLSILESIPFIGELEKK